MIFLYAGNYDINELRYTFGSSNEFTKSLGQNDKPNETKHREISSDYLQVEAQFLASCVYEEDTQWGKKASKQSKLSPSDPQLCLLVN